MSHSTRRLRPLVASLVFVLLVTACGGSNPASPATSPSSRATPAATADAFSSATVKALRAEPYGDANTDALVEALGHSGIAVVDGVGSTEPLQPVEGKASALRFTRWQAHAMGLEAATGGGLTGAELDSLIPAQTGTPRTSRIVAGYLAKVDSGGARLGRALLGERDWKAPDGIVFPTVVLATLSAELVRDAAAAGGTSSIAPRSLIGSRLASFREPVRGGFAAPNAGTCSDVTSFVDDTIAAVFDALKVKSDGSTAGDIAAGIWNFLVDIGEVIVTGALDVITAPVLAVIRAVAGGVAVVAMVVSIIQPWALRVTADPAVTRLAVGNEPGLPGVFRAEVDVGGVDDWPADVADCAAAASVPLPAIGATGATITWQPFVQDPSSLIGAGVGDPTIPEDTPGAIAWTTASETPEAAKGEERIGLVRSDVVVRRPGIRDLRIALQGLLFAQLPALVAAALEPILGPIIADLVDRIVELQDVRGSASVSVIYHVEPEETPKPEATNRPAGNVGHPCDYVSIGDVNAIAEGNWSQSRTRQGSFESCQFDDPGAAIIPPSFAVVSIANPYPNWDAIAKGAGAQAVSGLGDEAYFTGSGQVLFVRKGDVVISATVADMIVKDGGDDFDIDPAADREKSIALARLVLGKLP